VVIPARNETTSLPNLLPSLVAQLTARDEIVVIDDHSTDGTGELASELGARVIAAPALPAGWLGKPHACSIGAGATEATVLLFIDADVRPPGDLVDRVCAAVTAHHQQVVSVQPWHVTGSLVEQASVLCNVTALMGSGGFTALGGRVRTNVAFGPVLAIARPTYDAVGGHGHHLVRVAHTEDIALARAVGRSQVFSGFPDTRFRMYPDGLGQTIAGWTRSIATGARFTTWWLTLATMLWVWSLAGGWITMPIVYPLSAIQVWVLGRRAASIHPLTAVLYPVAVVVFAVIFLRSLIAITFGRQVSWKGRRVDAR
jgi:4,4'-diaponeurosporenoate glycosyltransferase